jgi:hypothetical protein
MKIANLSEPDNLNLMRGCGEPSGGETVGVSGGERLISWAMIPRISSGKAERAIFKSSA